VNCIAPGIVETERGIELPAQIRDRLRSAIPVGRFATAGDVANTMLFLASEHGRFLSGVTIRVDGGL
jgi:NAD(P)-dependent dehydrogenase (short-subunit alcohol dehydrogenase family)